MFAAANGFSFSMDDLPDTQAFADLAPALVQWLQQELAQAEGSCPVQPVLAYQPPEHLLASLPEGFPAQGDGDTAIWHWLSHYARHSNHLHQPRYIGHQVCPPLPLAALCDLVTSLHNNSGAVYEMSPIGTLMETRLVQWYCRLLGFPDDAGGIMTHGGSLGNFTALLAARQAKVAGDVWQNGYDRHAPRPAVLVSASAHYCMQRAVQMMGMGADAAVKVPTNDRYEMDMDALREAYRQAIADGFAPFAVCASACNTATGSFDPLPEIANFCQEHDLWMHVDAAHGGAFILSQRYQHLLKGIAHADSVVWDLHKMLRMPSLTTLVAFRDRQANYRAFLQEASYLFSGQSAEDEWYNQGQRMVECTKAVQGLRAFVCLMAYGTDYFADYITRMIDTTHAFAKAIDQREDMELAVEPACNIICFRYLPSAASDTDDASLNQLQQRIRDALMASGRYYIVQTILRGKRYLRCTVIHPKTDLAILQQLLDDVALEGQRQWRMLTATA